MSGVLTIALAVSPLAACGAPAGTGREQSGVVGRVHLGPQCPVETPGDRCADKPAAGSTVTVAEQVPAGSSAGERVVARTTTDAAGRYRIDLAPGRYVVTANAGMSCEFVLARVTPGSDSRADIPCDTGIR